MELFLEFAFTVTLSFVLSFIIAKLLSLSSIIDQHLKAVSRSWIEVTTDSEKYVLRCEKGHGFVSEVVKIDALAETVEEKDTLEEFLNGSNGSTKITEEIIEEIVSGEENLAKEDEEENEVLGCEKESGEDCLKAGLSDDDDWEGIERTELEKDFGAAVCYLECRSNADQTLKLSKNIKMQLYGLHKIATEGPCHETHPMALKLSARAKWNAWKRLGNMSPEAAMEQYITLLSRSIPGWTQDNVNGDSNQYSADVQASWKLALDAKAMPANQAIAADYRTVNELKGTHLEL